MQKIFAIVILAFSTILVCAQCVYSSEVDFGKEREDFLEAVAKNNKLEVTDKLEHLDIVFKRVTERFASAGKEETCYNKSMCDAFEEVKKLITFWDDVLEEAIEHRIDKKTNTIISKELKEKHFKFVQYRKAWENFLN